MLQLDDVHTYYGESHVLHGVSLTVEAGEIVCLLGRNGVGKTTTVRTIAGLTPPRRGRVQFLGQPIHGLPPHVIAQHGVGLVPQGRRVFTDLTVIENLRIAARPQYDGWTLERVYALFPRLEERATQYAQSLSGGEQQMLAIGRALVGNPRLLLMDEPSEGLAPLLIQEVRNTILELRQTGLSILLVEQNLPVAMTVADKVYIMTKGKIVFEGTPDILDANEAVKNQYLGIDVRG